MSEGVHSHDQLKRFNELMDEAVRDGFITMVKSPFKRPSEIVKYILIRCDNCGQEHEINYTEPYALCTCGGLYERVFE